MKASKVLEVYMHGERVGTLAETREHLVAFEYSGEWIQNGLLNFHLRSIDRKLEERNMNIPLAIPLVASMQLQ